MNLRSCSFLLILFLCVLTVNGQSAEKEKFLRISPAMVITHKHTLFRDSWGLTFGGAVPSYEVSSGRLLRKFEISELKYAAHKDDPKYIGDVTSLHLKMQYEMDYMIGEPESKVSTYIGAGISLYNSLSKRAPDDNVLSSGSRSYRMTAGFLIAPGVRIRLSERVNIDLNIPFTVVDFDFERSRYYNQLDPDKYYYSHLQKFDSKLDELRIKMGFGYKLCSK